jgi:hypothetical protein
VLTRSFIGLAVVAVVALALAPIATAGAKTPPDPEAQSPFTAVEIGTTP